MAEESRKLELRRVTVADLGEAIAEGLRDFRAAPAYGMALGGLYAAAGWLLVALLWNFGLPYLAYPLAMGFALVAPFAAVWFYAVSDLRQRGEPLSWGAIAGAVKAAARRDLRWMALVTGFALVLWMDLAALSFFAFMGFSDFGPDFFRNLFTTPSGLVFLLLGNLAGALIALAVFSLSVVSFPLLYDRDVDFVTAMVTSVKLVAANPVAMVIWCALIAALIAVSIVTAFAGLVVILPVIGHATWHLYRRPVTPAAAVPTPRPAATVSA